MPIMHAVPSREIQMMALLLTWMCCESGSSKLVGDGAVGSTAVVVAMIFSSEPKVERSQEVEMQGMDFRIPLCSEAV